MEIAQTADYGLRILDLLEVEDGLSIADLAGRLEVSRSVAQRVVTTLHRRTLVTKADNSRYVLGPALIQLAQSLPHPLAAAAAEALENLSTRTGETVVLAVPVLDEAVVVSSIAGRTGQLRVEYEVGFRHPLVRGASGLAMLAFMEGEHVGGGDAALLAALDGIRADGIANTAGQLRDHMVGMGVPIRQEGAVLGSVAIVAPSTRQHDVQRHAAALRETAAQIEAQWAASRFTRSDAEESGE